MDADGKVLIVSRSLTLVTMMLVGLISFAGCAKSVSKNRSPIATEAESAIADQVTSEKVAETNADEEQPLRKQAKRAQ